MNTYKKGLAIILKEGFEVKKLKTFRGMEGVGVNADIYFKKAKIAEVDDDAQGGLLRIKYFNDGKKIVEKLIKQLPQFTNKDRFGDDWSFDHDQQSFDDEEVFNAIINYAINAKEFNKLYKIT